MSVSSLITPGTIEATATVGALVVSVIVLHRSTKGRDMKLAQEAGARDERINAMEKEIGKALQACADHEEKLTASSVDVGIIKTEIQSSGKQIDEIGKRLNKNTELLYKIAGKLGIDGMGGG